MTWQSTRLLVRLVIWRLILVNERTVVQLVIEIVPGIHDARVVHIGNLEC